MLKFKQSQWFHGEQIGVTFLSLILLPLFSWSYMCDCTSTACNLCHVSLEEQPDLPEKPYEMATCMFTPTSGLSTTLRDILTDRPAVSKYHNFLRGFQMHNEYIQHEQFAKWKGIDNTLAHVTSNIPTVEFWECSVVTVLTGNKITGDGFCMYRTPAMGFVQLMGLERLTKCV